MTVGPAAAGRRRDLWVRLLLYPGHTLPTAAAPVLVAAGLAVRDGVLAPGVLALAFAGSWLIHVAGVIADNHELLRRHPRLPEHPELLQGLADGSLTLRQLRTAIAVCLALALLAGVYPVAIGGVPALAIGLLGVGASLGYACGPRPYAGVGLADPLFLLMFGVVAVAGAYYVQLADVRGGAAWSAMPASAFAVGLPIGCLVTNVLVIDDLRDRGFDSAKGWRTGPVRFGPHWSRVEHAVLSAVAYLLPVAFWLGLGLGPAVLLPWLTAPAAFGIARSVCRPEGEVDLRPMTPRASRLSMAYAALLGVGVALG